MLRNLPIKKKGLIVIAVPTLLTIGLLLILNRIGSALDEATEWTVHSQSVLGKAESAAGGLIAIHGENLQLALLGSSDSAFEVELRSQAVREVLVELQEATRGSAHQAEAVAAFAFQATALITDLSMTRQVLRQGERAEGAARVANDDRKLQHVLDEAASIKVAERRLAIERLDRAGQLSQQRRLALVAGGITTVLFVWIVGWGLLRSMLWRLLAVRQNVLRLAEDRELMPPIAAADEIGDIDLAVHQMVQALRAQRRDNDMFIYSVSHDLRSPLVNLQGFGAELTRSIATLRDLVASGTPSESQLAQVRHVIAEEMGESLHFIDLAVQRQSRIIDSLLSLSRVGRVEYRWQRVLIAPRVDDMIKEMKGQGGLSGVEFVLGDLPPAYGDPDALERVFDNLVRNAIKYLCPDRAGRIEIGGELLGNDEVRYFVRDNGIGIRAEHLERVFMPFSRFAGGEGEGIGLSLVRRVVDRHRGRVWIESVFGEGSVVWVQLRAWREVVERVKPSKG
jgi:signal transduction histidine kinase